MRLTILLFALIALLAFSSFASASWFSSFWNGHNPVQEIKRLDNRIDRTIDKIENRIDRGLDRIDSRYYSNNYYGSYNSRYYTASSSRSFDSQACGNYYWDVQDRSYCYRQWNKMGVHIKGW